MVYKSIYNISDIAAACNGLTSGKGLALIKAEPDNHTQLAYTMMDFTINGDKSNVITFFFIDEGEISITMDYMEHTIGSRTGFSIPPTAMVTSIKMSADIRAYVVIASAEYFDEIFLARRHISISHALFLRRNNANGENGVNGYRFSLQDFIVLRKALENLETQMKRYSHKFQKELVNNAFSSLVYESANILFTEISRTEEIQKASSTDIFVEKFVKLLSAHGDKEHSPAFYADKLCISVQYLSLILKRLSGQTANDWIAGYLVTRAKIMLRNPALTIQQVASMLYFSDQSSFGKFFKKHTGITPKQYKDEIYY